MVAKDSKKRLKDIKIDNENMILKSEWFQKGIRQGKEEIIERFIELLDLDKRYRRSEY